MIKLAWEKLASTTLTVASDEIDSGTFTAKNFLFIQVFTHGADTETQIRFNSTGNNEYCTRRQSDFGADSLFTSENQTKINATGGTTHTESFSYYEVTNFDGKEKLILGRQNGSEATGAGTAPRIAIGAAKWEETTQITSVQAVNMNGSGSFQSDSYITVYGSD